MNIVPSWDIERRELLASVRRFPKRYNIHRYQCNNPFIIQSYATMITVSILDRELPHASAAYVQISVFYREFPESLGTSKIRVKFQYLVHKSRKRSQRFCVHINEIYINFIRIKFCRNSHQRLNRLHANGSTIAN